MATASAGGRVELPRCIGFVPAAGILVGVTVGSGIYRTPAAIAKEMGSPLLVLALWVAGGMVCLAGALTYAELNTMYPHSGGLYNYLYHGFGRRIAFVFGWTHLLITKPLAAGGIAVVFAEYLGRALHVTWSPPVTVCVVLIALTFVNTLGMRLGAGAGAVLSGVKVASLVVIVACALLLPGGSAANLTAATAPPRPLLLALGAVMAAILWTYDGWSDVGSIAGEVHDPQRTLPRVYLAGTAGIILIYVAVNAAYTYVLPLAEERQTDAVASAVMARLAGPGGAALVSAFVLLSTLGSTHASIITGARVSFAQSRDGMLFRFLSRVHPRHGTPAVALWTQCVLSCAAVLVMKRFESLTQGFVFTMWIFYGLGGLAVFVLRARQPDVARPYRCWGYPWMPAVFILSAVAMTGLMLWDSLSAGDWSPLAWLAVLAAGWPACALWERWTGARPVVGTAA